MRAAALTARSAQDILGGPVVERDVGEAIRRVLQGDPSAYELIVARYQERLYWVAFQFLKNHDDAQDLTQDAFLRIYRKLGTFDPSRRFYTWAYRIVTNLAIDRLRSRARMKSSPLSEEIEDEGDGPPKQLLGEELRAEVRDVLEELPPRYRALLLMRDAEGFSGKEIAETSGVSHATIRWRIHRARQLFRDAWERRVANRRRGGRR